MNTPLSLEQNKAKELRIAASRQAPNRHFVLKGQSQSNNPLNRLELGLSTVSGISNAIGTIEEAYLEIKMGDVVQRRKIPENASPKDIEDFLMYASYAAPVEFDSHQLVYTILIAMRS